MLSLHDVINHHGVESPHCLGSQILRPRELEIKDVEHVCTQRISFFLQR